MNNFKIGTVIILISFLSINVFSQTRITTDFKDYSLEIFKTTNIKNLDIRGNHAQINILNWDKDSISVETSLEILSNKPNLSKEMLDEIKIKVVTYSNTLQVKTSFTDDFNRTIPYKIMYNIFCPKNISLQIQNSNGQVNIAEILGKVNVKLDYCKINIKNLAIDKDSISNDIELNYCNGSINKFGYGKMVINNSTIQIPHANTVNLISNYSIIEINKIDTLKSISKIDNFKIGYCSKTEVRSNSSTIQMAQIGTESLFECTDGNLSINNTSETLKKLTINNNNTLTTVKVNKLVSYSINGEIYRGKLIHPQLNKLQLVKETGKISFNGVIGNNPQSDSKIIVFNTNQNVEFK